MCRRQAASGRSERRSLPGAGAVVAERSLISGGCTGPIEFRVIRCPETSGHLLP
jgi:hypothetical protein